jgi:hypothetical protein
MIARKRFTVSVDGATWTVEEIILPKKIQIKRVRAILDDPGNVAVSFRETSSASSDLDIPLEYALTTSPLDSEENIYAEAKGSDPKRGTFYVAVKGSVATQATVQIEYES